jgi:hypothetical protein
MERIRHLLSRLVVLAAVLTLAVGALTAGDDDDAKKEKKQKPKREAPPLEAVSLSGTLTRNEKQVKNRKTGEEKTVIQYFLVAADGQKTPVPPPAQKAGEEGAVNLDDYVDQAVTIHGEGRVIVKQTKDGKEKRIVRFKKISSIQPGAVGTPGGEDEAEEEPMDDEGM